MLGTKKFKLAVAVIAAIISITVLMCTTWSWFVSSDKKLNSFKLGEAEFGVKLVDYFDEPGSFPPGGTRSKVVGAENANTIPAFVRIMVMPAIVSVNDQPLEAKIGKQIELLGLNTTKWVDGGDGYYYYLDILGAAGSGTEASEDLFTGVRLSGTVGPEYKDARMNIVVKTEAVDTKKWNYRFSWWGSYTQPQLAQLLNIDQILRNKAR